MSAATEALHGSCLCGAVAFAVTTPVIAMGNCHCSICRHAHGTAFSTYCQIDAAGLEVTRGEAHIERFAASAAAERSFCRTCGSKLFFRAHALPQLAWVAAGALDDDPGVEVGFHIFVGSKAPWYHITDDLPQYEEFPPGDAH